LLACKVICFIIELAESNSEIIERRFAQADFGILLHYI
jgi:hypothetical protein